MLGTKMECPAVLLLLVFVLPCALVDVTRAQYSQHIYVNAADPNANDTIQCWRGELPCKTLNFALQGVTNSTEVDIESSTDHEYRLDPDTNATVFRGMQELAIVGYPPDGSPVVINCEPHAGLTFIDSAGIVIENVNFSGCGVLHNSTSRDFSNKESFSFLEFQAGLYFLFCKDVNFSRVTVSNSSGTGMVMYSTVGVNTFQECNFSHNTATHTTYPGGGGLYIEFPFCSPDKPQNCANSVSEIPTDYASNAKYTISNSHFSFNDALIQNPVDYTFLQSQHKNHLSFGRGGGLSVYFSNASNSSIVVDRCTFIENEAFWGGGVFVEFQGASWNNSFTMLSSSVADNRCYYDHSERRTMGGGGMRIGYIFLNNHLAHNGHNQMSFWNCSFDHNKAFWGGGVSFNAAREPDLNVPTNTLEFKKCKWTRNVGRIASALDMSVWHLPGEGTAVRPILTNCSFTSNTDKLGESKYGGHIVGVGTVYIDSMPVSFNDSVYFKHNDQSAIFAVETSVDFLDNCVANFANNSGRIGGAISLWGYAFVRVHENTVMNFTNNLARLYGGAISSYTIGQHGLSYGNCLIQYYNASLDPWNWTSKFYFQGNKRAFNNGSNSIAAVSLLPCLWGSYTPESKSREDAAKDVFCWGENWNYGDQNCSAEIASSPARFGHNNSPVEVFPGKLTALNLTTIDDRGEKLTNQKDMVITAWSYTSDAHVANSSVYISDNSIKLYGKPNSTAKIGIETIDPRVIITSIHVKLLPCPPGHIPHKVKDYEDVDGYDVCKCGGTYSGNVYCHGMNASLQRGHWMGFLNKTSNNSQVVVGMCAFTSSAMPDHYTQLPNDSAQLDHRLCGHVGRTGVLCGDCRPGYGVAANSKTFDCVKCSQKQAKYSWVFFVLSRFVPITVFFIMIVIFQISITRGPANAFVFFAQVITTTFDIDGDGTIPLNHAETTLETVYTIAYDIWNLNFFRPIVPDYCLSPQLDTLGLIALNYLVAVYPLLLIAIFYLFVWLYDGGVRPVLYLFRPIHRCFAGLRRRWNLQRSIVDAFATFLVLSYTKFTVVSVYLITPVPLVDDQGNEVAKVLYYNGNITFLSDEHIPYFILAICVMAVFVLIPPLLLLRYPLKLLQKMVACFGHEAFATGGRLQMFLDTFQGCYKDGTNGSRDCRYFAGLYFVLRTVLFTLYVYTGRWFMQYIAQQLVCTIAILLFAIIRPYKNNFYSNLDATIFAILAAINTFSIYNIFHTSMNLSLSSTIFTFQYILIFSPLLYAAAFVIWQFYNANKEIIKPKFTKVLSWLQIYGNSRFRLKSVVSERECPSTSTIDEDYRDYTLTVEAYGRDRERNTYRPFSPSTPTLVDTSSGVSESETAPLMSNSGTREESRGRSSSSGYGATMKNQSD